MAGNKFVQWQTRLLTALIGYAVHLFICVLICDAIDAPSVANYYYPKTVGLGMLTGRPLLVGAGLVTVLTDQLCWTIDCIGFLFTGKFIIGAAKYLTWPTISLARKLTSFHHLWFFPLCFYTLQYELPRHSWSVSCVFTLVGLVYCRFWTPKDASDGTHVHYLNVNGAFEFWKDVPIAILHRWDHPKASAISYLVFLFCFGNTVNFILSSVF